MVSMEISRIDNYIIRNLGVKTPEEIADYTGIDAKEIVQRGKEVLNSIDVLTRPERVNKILIRLEQVADETYDRIEEGVDEKNLAGLVNSVRQLYGTVLKELREISRIADGEYDEAQTRYAMMLSEIVGRSFERTLNELKETYPELPEREMERVFRSNLLEVSASFEEQVNV